MSIIRLAAAFAFGALAGCGGADDADHKDAKRFDQLVSKINDLAVNGRYTTRNSTTGEKTTFKTNRVVSEIDGGLRVVLDYCTPRDVPVDKTFEYFAKYGDNLCPEESDWAPHVTTANLERIDPDNIRVVPFTREGQMLDILGILYTREQTFALADGFGLVARCKDNENCVEYSGVGSGPALYIPCPDGAACDGVMENIKRLIELASTPSFSEWTAKRVAALSEPLEIRSKRNAQQAVRAMAGRFTDESFVLSDAESGSVSIQTVDARLVGKHTLELDIRFCRMSGETCVDAFSENPGVAEIPLAALAGDEIEAVEIEELGKAAVWLACENESNCVKSEIDGTIEETPLWFVSCGDIAECHATARALRGLVAYAKGDRNDSAKTATDADRSSNRTKNELAPRRLRRSLDRLASSVNGAEARFAAREGPSARLMVGRGAQLDEAGQLIIGRDVCLALQPIGFARRDGCGADSLFQAYDLSVDLAGVDPKSIAHEQGAENFGEHGNWIEADCKPQYACARIVIPNDPPYLRAQIASLMLSFGETQTAPKFRIPCGDESACKDAAKALRALSKKAPRSRKKSRDKPRWNRKDLIGVWAFESPFPTGWTYEFKQNGDYVFDNGNGAGHAGTYKAKDGAWSHITYDKTYEDGGTYRFVDEDTLELTGKWGVSTWKRRTNKK